MLAEVINEKTRVVSEWIEWKGGPCPLDRRQLCMVRLRFEKFFDDSQLSRRAESWGGWVHRGNDDLDILWYKVVDA